MQFPQAVLSQDVPEAQGTWPQCLLLLRALPTATLHAQSLPALLP